ncbi:MAG: HDOD domain-containing protein [Rhodocyclales bacterium GT-UBC]|nr:MAG: HDOD domain-containing protein [Rhodocyclales bacterium GT-UBC]
MSALPEEKQLQTLLQGVDIPPCPAILVELDAEMRKDEPDQREIARLISHDVALSGRLMLVANSPAFSTGRELGSVTQALAILGNRQVFNLVISQLLKAALAGAPDIPMDRFWDSSALTAKLAAELARRLRCIRPDIAYTFGLFHDCGIPLIMKRFEKAREVLAAANAAEFVSFTDIEEELLGTNHAVVGYFLARRWRLPDYVAESILYHHDYAMLEDGSRLSAEARILIALCVLAEHVIRLQANGEGEYEWSKASALACGVFGLSLGNVDDLIEDMLDWLV